jgi:hypothetical protein
MSRNDDIRRWLVDRYCTQQELIKNLVDGLDRALTHPKYDCGL